MPKIPKRRLKTCKMKSTDTDKVAYQVSQILIDLGCIIIRPHQPFKFNTGITSPVYTDNRLILSSPKQRSKIIDLLIKRVKHLEIPDVVAGTSTAGIPHAAFVAQRLNLPMIYVRTEPKKYGRKNQVEGSFRKGQKVLVIDDLISTGRSCLEVVKAVRKLGGKVTNVLAITTYGLKEAEKNFEKHKVKLHVLTDLNHSCEVAVKNGILKKERVDIIKEWSKDPEGWGKKMGFE